MKLTGIIFIVAGILMLIFKGFSFTQEKKVVDLGPVEINKKENHHIGWPLYAGGIAIGSGILLVAGSKKK